VRAVTQSEAGSAVREDVPALRAANAALHAATRRKRTSIKLIHISPVARGLDPRVHPLRMKMDCRVKPGNDAGRMSAHALILLSYKLRRPRCTAAAPQHGQRGKRVTIAAMSLRRMVAIEFGMCRSGRKGGSSGSITVGYGKLREQSGGTRS
jgi:hypothetical protein